MLSNGEIVTRVDQLRSEGLSVSEACKKAKIHLSTYYNQRKKTKPNRPEVLKGRTPKVETLVFPTKTESKVAVVFGSPSQIAEILRGMP